MGVGHRMVGAGDDLEGSSLGAGSYWMLDLDSGLRLGDLGGDKD